MRAETAASDGPKGELAVGGAADPRVGEQKRVLSGVQPTGALHIGNYVGALSVWAEQQEAYENFFCVADLHALTIPESVRAADLRRKSREVAALYIAAGIDPVRSVIFLQSAVPAHPYLAWILTCCTPLGWLERMTQYKSKAGGLETVGAGLLTYPALQAADILLYQAHLVPVGEDQKQHIELTRDIAQRFNHHFGPCFRLPEPLVRQSGARIMGLDDPTVKMSKSLAETRGHHAIRLLDEPAAIKKTIMGAVTDSGSEISFERSGAGVRNLLVLYEILSGRPRAEIEARFAGRGYGALKRELVDLAVATLEPLQTRYREIAGDVAGLERLLEVGAARAAAQADATLARARELCGI